MQRYGLIGYPVTHSFSAAMHNAAFAHLGMPARYELFELESALDVRTFLQQAARHGIAGLNVTIPHKEAAFGILTDFVRESRAECSAEVCMIGALNTINVDNNNFLSGYNTDSLGFARHVSELGIDVERVALVGGGGAAKAVAVALARLGTKELAIYDIDESRAAHLAEKVFGRFPECHARAAASVGDLNLDQKRLLVNASPVGMKTAMSPVSIELLHRDLFVYDLIYNPPRTPLLNAAEAKGLRSSNGLTMLLYQGVLAFEQWTGTAAPEAVMRRALEQEMERCRIS